MSKYSDKLKIHFVVQTMELQFFMFMNKKFKLIHEYNKFYAWFYKTQFSISDYISTMTHFFYPFALFNKYI